jgi:hypothetical protein
MPAIIFAIAAGCSMLVALATKAHAQVPDAIAAGPGEAAMLTVHAEGAQIYECRAQPGGKLAWQLREPIASLMLDGKTIGRHFAGPTWELLDGSAVSAKVMAQAPGKAANDIPWLRLEVTSQRGAGELAGASSIQRINTNGGSVAGPCDRGGTLRSVPYSADYVFLRKGG